MCRHTHAKYNFTAFLARKDDETITQHLKSEGRAEVTDVRVKGSSAQAHCLCTECTAALMCVCVFKNFKLIFRERGREKNISVRGQYQPKGNIHWRLLHVPRWGIHCNPGLCT